MEFIEIDWLKQWNQYSPKNIAVLDGDTNESLTYKQLFISAQKAASILKNKYKVKKGDRIALFSTNEIESLALFFGAQRLGAILVPINFRLTAREVAHIINDSSPQVVLFEKEFETTIEEVKKQSFDFQSQVFKFTDQNNFVYEMNSCDSLYRDFNAHFEDSCLILYTSGTTGAPKGAVLTHKTLFWNSLNTTLRLNLNQSDCTVTFLPLFHTGGWNVLTTPFLHRGAKLIFLKKFDAERVLALSEREKATILFGVPTTMDLMAQHPKFKEFNLSSLRYAIVGGEPMPIDLIHTWSERNVPIRQGYGLTEFGPNVFSLNEEDSIRKIGSIGFPNFYIETKVILESGEEAKDNEIGELVLRGPMMMKEYWHNPKATEQTIQNGWLYTGDLVRRDEEGYFYVVGRKKDMYISGGENVYPPEIEQILRLHPSVAEAAVIGVPDPKWGEVGKAFVVLKNKTTSEKDLHEFCAHNLAKFKVPKYFTFLPQLPKGDSGKILKRALQ